MDLRVDVKLLWIDFVLLEQDLIQFRRPVVSQLVEVGVSGDELVGVLIEGSHLPAHRNRERFVLCQKFGELGNLLESRK